MLPFLMHRPARHTTFSLLATPAFQHGYCCPPFTDRKTEAQKVYTACLKSHWRDLYPSLLTSKTIALNILLPSFPKGILPLGEVW